MGVFLIVLGLASGFLMAQNSQQENAPVGLSDLPSANAKAKIPSMEEPSPAPDFGAAQPESSPSIPKLRAPAKDEDKAKDQEWLAQGMQKKREEAKKKEQEQAALAEQKDREDQQDLEKEKKGKQEAAAKASKQPAVAKPAALGFTETDTAKLPAVTGLEGVRPRSMESGDGRVQPGFDAFTGPSTTGPLGKDFQSGAKPIMPGNSSTDGRIQVPPQPPSGAYKRISQDPNSLPAGYGEKKPVAAPPPKPVTVPANPDSGDTKKVDLNDTKAGYSPYDSTKRVPDPRSQRRF